MGDYFLLASPCSPSDTVQYTRPHMPHRQMLMCICGRANEASYTLQPQRAAHPGESIACENSSHLGRDGPHEGPVQSASFLSAIFPIGMGKMAERKEQLRTTSLSATPSETIAPSPRRVLGGGGGEGGHHTIAH